jgi:hypothetical protein
MSRTVVVANKTWEADPLTTVLAASKSSAPGSAFERVANEPGLRGLYHTKGGSAEIWCLQELMSPHVSSSSTEEKARVLPALVGGDDVGLVIAFGTAASIGPQSRNGCVVIGTKAFLHDPGSTRSKSRWFSPLADAVLDSPLPNDDFDGWFTDPAYRPLVEARMLPTPVNPAALRTVLNAYDYVALADINITNYADYAWADQAVVDAYLATHAKEPIGSLETTHGVIRSCTRAPFAFVSGITDRVGFFNEEIAPRDYAQNFVAAHNAAVAFALLVTSMA